ncbi:hypothetical protein PLESTF_000186700 [Pleodorina starrii]|nr:hypothetical protein PLESTF_000186700 [Pleodorina starrii]
MNTQELIENYINQMARIQPISHLLANILPAVAPNSTAVLPQAIQIRLQTWFEKNKVDTSSLAATVDTLAQLGQGVLNYQSHVQTISENLRGVVSLLKQRIDSLPNSSLNVGGTTLDLGGLGAALRAGAAGRRRGLQQQVDTKAAIKAKVKAAVDALLKSPEAAPYVGELRKLYDLSTLPDLVASLYDVLMQLVPASDELRDIMSRLDGHFDKLEVLPSLPIYNPRTKTNLLTIASPVPYDKRTTVALTGPARRRLQAADPLRAALLRTELPSTFKPANSSVMPRLYIPLVFHVLTYRQGSNAYGPPGYERTPEYVDRILSVVNAMALPTKIQFFVNELRYEPEKNPYILKASRDEWMACASQGRYLYKDCSSVLQGALDHPRSINVYVVGDRADATFAGYGWVPSSAYNISNGHVAILWSVLDAAVWNSQAGFEYGGKVLWHELMHHLGLSHTFGRANVAAAPCSSNADDGIPDTPIVAGPSYSQRFASAARTYCYDVFNNAMSSNWDTVMDNWRNALGIPAADSTHGFDSCTTQPGYDELGNYISYTHDVCVVAMGHVTYGQSRYMHLFGELAQRRLYTWAQYFAALAPQAFKVAPRSAERAAETCAITRGGCRCRASWTFQGKPLSGCAKPDDDPVGLWCPVELDGNCPSAINGYWDYCQANATERICTNSANSTQSNKVVASRSPPPAAETCGPGTATVSGSVCAREAWAMTDVKGDFEIAYLGCANPDNDPQGAWCRLLPGHTTLTGRTWDYCDPTCGPPPPERIIVGTGPGGESDFIDPDIDIGDDGDSTVNNSNGSTALGDEACAAHYQVLPTGCTCRKSWGVFLQPPFGNGTASVINALKSRPRFGRRYINARHCTAIPELQPTYGLMSPPPPFPPPSPPPPEPSQPPMSPTDVATEVPEAPGPVGVCEVTGCKDAAYNGRIMVCRTACTTLRAEEGEDVPL